MKPIFKVNGHNYTVWLADEGLKSSRNDMDAEGSGRNLLDGLMYRSRIASKKKWTVTFNRVNEIVAAQLLADMLPEFVSVTLLDPQTNTQTELEYYTSTVTEGTQRYRGGETVYDGITFNLTER